MRPAKGVGSLERFLMGAVGGRVIGHVMGRLRSHPPYRPYRSVPGHSSPSSSRFWERPSCPTSSPSQGDGREIYHSGIRFGNYPFVAGTRPNKRRILRGKAELVSSMVRQYGETLEGERHWSWR